MDRTHPPLTTEHFDAVLFDLDGVLTETASIHAAAWRQMFDQFLRKRAEDSGEAFVPFDIESDYRAYVDGKPRSDGVRSFLSSRTIELPEGDAGDPITANTVIGLGNRKNQLVTLLPHLQLSKIFHATLPASLLIADR